LDSFNAAANPNAAAAGLSFAFFNPPPIEKLILAFPPPLAPLEDDIADRVMANPFNAQDVRCVPQMLGNRNLSL
jgi:hypothetical protein